DHRQPGWVVRSTSYSAVLGNVLLDLSVARIPDSDTYLDITAVLGGVQVILPPELPVSCEGTAILGSVSAFGQSASGGLASRDFARHGSDGSRSSLRIRCRAILGSVDIR
ncbi:MAG: LiaF-related protein, partial [Firmicutes bacterium]|nr:LiaF-related protein [Bacillota bacterium]